MSEVLQANIFFFITAASVIVLTVFLSIVFFHAIKIVRAIRRIVERIEEGSENLADDFAHIRSTVSGAGSVLTHLLGFKAMMRRSAPDDEEEEVVSEKRSKRKSKLSIVDESD